MDRAPREVSWKALEHHHFEKSVEWFVILILMIGTFVVSAYLLGNELLAVLLLLAGVAIVLASLRRPRMVSHAVSARGVRVGMHFFPYQSLHSYTLDEEHRNGPHLLILPKHWYAAVIVMPIPEDMIDDIEDILAERLPEDDLEEPFYNLLLEIFRF